MKVIKVAYLIIFISVGLALLFHFYIKPDIDESAHVQMKIDHEETGFVKNYVLPLPGSAPAKNIKHTIPLEEIKRGCGRQDCIPSVDEPNFVAAASLQNILSTSSLGIVIHEAGRFYPFPMLETREIVNDILPDGRAVAVTYCPLCGTGIVFDRKIRGEVFEFGVSGMLWQSNLLMYNRSSRIEDRNLWSQVLGQAVVGDMAGVKLSVIPSAVITFGQWLDMNPKGMTLSTGGPQNPYGGDYYKTAKLFQPNFTITESSIEPMTRVHGVIVDCKAKAYVSENLFNDMTDLFNGERIFVTKDETRTTFFLSNAELGLAPTVLSDIEGFWFSWKAAHPETELWIE